MATGRLLFEEEVRHRDPRSFQQKTCCPTILVKNVKYCGTIWSGVPQPFGLVLLQFYPNDLKCNFISINYICDHVVHDFSTDSSWSPLREHMQLQVTTGTVGDASKHYSIHHSTRAVSCHDIFVARSGHGMRGSLQSAAAAVALPEVTWR